MRLNVDLAGLVRSKIESEGPIAIKDFLTYVLKVQNEHFSPQAMTKEVLSGNMYRMESVLGSVIVDWCINLWEAHNKPKALNIIEFCPRGGILVLKTLEQIQNKVLSDAVHIYIVEPNLYFKTIQKQNLRKYLNKITWVESFEKIAIEDFSIIIANEFFSSLPIDQYTRRKGEWLVNMVDLTQDFQHFCITHTEINDNMNQYLESKYAHVPEGGIIELHDEASILLKNIVESTKKFGGGSLLIDLGYIDHNKRDFLSTLQAGDNRCFSPIFYDLGNSLLSSQLNFSNLKKGIELYGGQVHGPITQSDFLSNMNIEQKRLNLLERLPSHKHSDVMTEYERLTCPKQFGNLFKTMSVCELLDEVAGFAGS